MHFSVVSVTHNTVMKIQNVQAKNQPVVTLYKKQHHKIFTYVLSNLYIQTLLGNHALIKALNSDLQ